MKKRWYLSATAGLTLGYLSTLAILSSPVAAQTFAPFAIAPAVVTLPIATIATESATYTVVLGDTLYGISRRKGLSLTDLITLNRNTVPDPDLIRVGQVLRLSASETSISEAQSSESEINPAPKRHRRTRIKQTAKRLPSRPEETQTRSPEPEINPVPKQRRTQTKSTERKPPIEPESSSPNAAASQTPKVSPPKTAKAPGTVPVPSTQSDLSKTALSNRRRSLLAGLPTQKLSGNRLGAAKRGSCAAPGQKLVALLPDTNLGQTVADQPTFFWSMPELKPEWQNRKLHSRFRLTEVDAQDIDIDPPVYETEFDSGPTGINSLTVPEPIPVGRNLRWTLIIVCDPDDPDGNEYVKGWIRRVEPSPELSAELEKANLVDYPAIYAKAGLWFDALRYLSAIRRKVGDQSIDDDWAALLNQVNLGDLAKKPINCQQNQSSNDCAAVPQKPQ
jgi:LysM repeat protein